MAVSAASRGLAKRFAVLCDIDREWSALAELPAATAEDSLPLAYRLVIEAHVVQKLISEPGILKKRARETDAFRAEFEKFRLDGSEGYLLSFIAGGLAIENILLASSLGRFRTMFALAQLRQKGVILFTDQTELDLDASWSRRRLKGGA